MNTPQLKALLEALKTNVNCDWQENDPAEEFQALAGMLEAALSTTDRDNAIERLGHYVSEDDVEEAYDKLTAQAEIDGSVSADNIICIWEPLEFRYTVDQLLSEVH